MAQNPEIMQAIRQAVSQVVDRHVEQLRSEMSAAVEEVVGTAIAAPGQPPAPGSGSPGTEALNDALRRLQDATAQADILRQLLDGCSNFAARCALFVVRGGNLNGWQSRGFRQGDAVRHLVINTASGVAAQVMHERAPLEASPADFSRDFGEACGTPAEAGLLLPLVIKGKVSAVVYADRDADAGGTLDGPALQALVRTAGLWLEILALRKAGLSSAGASEEVAHGEVPAGAAAFSASAAAAVRGSASETLNYPPPQPQVFAAPPAEPSTQAAAEAAPFEEAATPTPAAAYGVPAAEVHRKAKRFAKLLVEEIKLYNQAKVAEGRAAHDLYDRLREDIDKSRATYQNRFGQSEAGAADYFTAEVVRILADNDRSLLGQNFPQ